MYSSLRLEAGHAQLVDPRYSGRPASPTLISHAWLDDWFFFTGEYYLTCGIEQRNNPAAASIDCERAPDMASLID
jgi:hypothetical protein